MQNQSFRQVYVAKTGKLLSSGTTLNLAANQVGIFDYPSYLATKNPDYSKNKTLIIARGVNPAQLTITSLLSNSPEYSKEISGVRVTGWRAKRAKKGRHCVYAVGFDGYDHTKTLHAHCGDIRHLYLRFTGRYVGELYSEKGITRQFSTRAPKCSDCGTDDCAEVSSGAMADDLVAQINADEVAGKFIRARKLQYCNPAVPTNGTQYKMFDLVIRDGGNGTSLAAVQVKYPNYIVSWVADEIKPGASTYRIIAPGNTTSIPAFSNEALTLLSECGGCPAGYTQVASGVAYEISLADTGADITTALQGLDGALAGTAKKRGVTNGWATYTLVAEDILSEEVVTALKTAHPGIKITVLGVSGEYCVLTTPGTINWVNTGYVTSYPRQYLLTIKGECDADRLSEVQAAYPFLVIDLDEPDPDGSGCVQRYKATVLSSPVETGCAMDLVQWKTPDPFEGTIWEPAPVAANVSSACSWGIEITVGVLDRVTNECTYDYWAEQFETVHLQISEYNPDYNADPDEVRWPVTKLQALQYPVGTGGWVREQEKKSLSYQLRERSGNPIIRELEGYSFAADPNQMYDEYTLEFSYNYMSGGFSETVTDRYHLAIYFPIGTGKEFESAINAWVSTLPVKLEQQIL